MAEKQPIEETIAALLEAATEPGSKNRLAVAELREQMRDYLAFQAAEEAEFPSVAGQDHWSLTMEGESNREGLRRSPMHAARQGIWGEIMTRKHPDPPSIGQEKFLPIQQSVTELTKGPTAVVGENLSRKSRLNGRVVRVTLGCEAENTCEVK